MAGRKTPVRSGRRAPVVLVTAAAGAAGDAVVTALLQRTGRPGGPRKVLAVDERRGSEPADGPRALWRLADLADPGAAGEVLRDADVVVHVAADRPGGRPAGAGRGAPRPRGPGGAGGGDGGGGGRRPPAPRGHQRDGARRPAGQPGAAAGRRAARRRPGRRPGRRPAGGRGGAGPRAAAHPASRVTRAAAGRAGRRRRRHRRHPALRGAPPADGARRPTAAGSSATSTTSPPPRGSRVDAPAWRASLTVGARRRARARRRSRRPPGCGGSSWPRRRRSAPPSGCTGSACCRRPARDLAYVVYPWVVAADRLRAAGLGAALRQRRRAWPCCSRACRAGVARGRTPRRPPGRARWARPARRSPSSAPPPSWRQARARRRRRATYAEP